MSLAIIQYGYEVKFGLHKMWGGLPYKVYIATIDFGKLDFDKFVCHGRRIL